MLIDGEKYACEACVRGHRVSNCQHSDRPLQHINKKGRPVSQCQHCRNMRKSRSAHIKCDCGEKTSKCAHLQQPVEGHKETCCCNHGGRCTCCHTKDSSSLGTVPESDSDDKTPSVGTPSHPRAPARRRRANTVHSDTFMSFGPNGHHKPSPKHNRAAQKCSPYQLNRVSSVVSSTSLGASPEALPLNTGVEGPSPGCSRSRASTVPEQRQAKSETASPQMADSTFPQLGPGLPPLDLSRIRYSASYAGDGTFEMFGNTPSGEQEVPMYSAGLSAASVDWSHYDLGDSKGDFASSSLGQPGAPNFGPLYDFGSGSDQPPHLGNTTSTSGEVSEVEDLLATGDGDYDGFGTEGGGFLRQGNMVSSSTDLSAIRYEPFYSKSPEGSGLPATNSMVEEDPAFWVPDYNEGVSAVDEGPDLLTTSTMDHYWET